MSEEDEKKQFVSPGPIWVWILVAIIIAQVVKRVTGNSKPPTGNFTTDFMNNFTENILYGLPVMVLYIITGYVLASKRNK